MSPQQGTNKVTVVGVGATGIACTVALLTKKITNSVCLIDKNEGKASGEMLDLQHGSVFLKNANVTAGSDFALSCGSRVCIICAGGGLPGQSRLDVVKDNAELMKAIIPHIAKHSPNAIILMVANPVDIMTYVAWKLSGFPKERVIGSGTTLDTARFRWYLSQKVGLSVSDCQGWIIGEHGDSSVPVWSGVNFAGVRLQDLNPDAGLKNDQENWAQVHDCVVQGAYEVQNRKGYTNWALGLCAAAITESILKNEEKVFAVSVHAKGLYDIKEDVFLSLPAIIYEDGIHDVVKLKLTDCERNALQESARILAEAQAKVA